MICSIENCFNPVRAKGWCNTHYARWYRTGNPLSAHPRRKVGLTISEILELYVQKGKPDECWLWTKSTNNDGYGHFGFKGRMIDAHRATAEIIYGPLTSDIVVRHSCDIPLCCNPKHLLMGTQADNIADCHRRKRSRWHRN